MTIYARKWILCRNSALKETANPLEITYCLYCDTETWEIVLLPTIAKSKFPKGE